MSRPAYMREQNWKPKLLVVEKAMNFKAHTINIISNPKIFKPRFNNEHYRIMDLARDIFSNIWNANGINANNNPQNWISRKNYQKKAKECIQILYNEIANIRKLNHLRTKKVEYWIKMLEDLEETHEKWMKSDQERYGDLEKLIKNPMDQIIESNTMLYNSIVQLYNILYPLMYKAYNNNR